MSNQERISTEIIFFYVSSAYYKCDENYRYLKILIKIEYDKTASKAFTLLKHSTKRARRVVCLLLALQRYLQLT